MSRDLSVDLANKKPKTLLRGLSVNLANKKPKKVYVKGHREMLLLCRENWIMASIVQIAQKYFLDRENFAEMLDIGNTVKQSTRCYLVNFLLYIIFIGS